MAEGRDLRRAIEQTAPDQNHSPTIHSGLKHTLMMAVCCLTPLSGVLLLNWMGYGGAASFLMLLLCPIMHLFMMRRHSGRSRSDGEAGTGRVESG